MKTGDPDCLAATSLPRSETQEASATDLPNLETNTAKVAPITVPVLVLCLSHTVGTPVSQKGLSIPRPQLLCLPTVGLASEDKQAEVQAAKTAGDMWKAIGKDSWVVVPIASTSRPGTHAHAHSALHRYITLYEHALCEICMHLCSCLRYRYIHLKHMHDNYIRFSSDLGLCGGPLPLSLSLLLVPAALQLCKWHRSSTTQKSNI